jgi:Asp-tRNA(Asn)/Glu-tRNA(Gln) amidotransferase A subunit family amidase
MSSSFELGYFTTQTIEDLAQALRSRVITSRELIGHAFRSIKALNPRLNSFSSLDELGALAAADQADVDFRLGVDRGPLQGIPVAIKDIFDVAGQPTTAGSALYANRVAERDAESVLKLRSGGAVIVGKTVLHEFAFGATGDRSVHGASRNPFDPSRMSGGSSGGSAVAVASGMVPLALGTDTAGSVRVPAALCGIVGYKPAYDAISAEGVYPLAPSLDHVGLFTRSVDDAKLAYDVIAREPIATSDLRSPRIGWITAFGPIEQKIEKQAFESILAAGIEPEWVALSDAENLFEIFSTIQSSEAFSEHVDDIARGAAVIDNEVLARLKRGAGIFAWEYLHATKLRRRFQTGVESLFVKYDLLASPTVPMTAPKIDEREMVIDGSSVEVRSALLSLTSPWNLVGAPALSIPCGMLNRLPIGLQMIGLKGKEGSLFEVAKRIGQRSVMRS